MKVLLIHPPSCDPLTDEIFLFEPLALEYLGAGLKKDGHAVQLLDARIEPDFENSYRRFQPDVVGLTGFTSHLNIIKKMAERLKAISPKILIIVGGHHATVRPNDFNDAQIDAVVIGEGVFTLREILSAVEAGSSFSHIDGIAIPHVDGMIFSKSRPYTDLNELPFPDRSLTADYRKQYFSEWFTPLASVRTSLGCTARCTFCALWKITEGKYLRRTPEQVVEELQTVAEPNVFFCDDESMCDVKRMDKLADLIAAAGIRKKYFLYGRVDTIVNYPELFAKWSKIGLVQVFVGMEDFSDTRLKAMKKWISTVQQAEAVKILDSLGIMMYASYMVDPAYTQEDFSTLMAYVRKMKHKYATFTVMTPLPGTELHDTREEELLSRKPELYDMLHPLFPTTLPIQDFYKEFANLWIKAVPFYRVVPTLFRFGLHGMLIRIKLFRRVLEKFKTMHLDY
ncbi:MAG: B12-binding domain-containing radical SAM protein [Geobacteraceae bacterium GWB2_52_12]|nr:MAG: B12-binding domain-containing radical SAM protein [Geobacteraceae bacterium GWB2_52_12]